jgi:polyhydroxyalkanoate synthesis regulator phasin
MAKTQARTNVIDEARARFEDALGNAKREFKRVQKDADKRRKDLEARVEREVKKFRTELEKRPLVKRAQELREQAEARVEELRSELRESAAMKRAEELREQAQARYGEMLGYAGIATAAEVERLEKRVAALSRELKAKKTAKHAAVAVA